MMITFNNDQTPIQLSDTEWSDLSLVISINHIGVLRHSISKNSTITAYSGMRNHMSLYDPYEFVTNGFPLRLSFRKLDASLLLKPHEVVILINFLKKFLDSEKNNQDVSQKHKHPNSYREFVCFGEEQGNCLLVDLAKEDDSSCTEDSFNMFLSLGVAEGTPNNYEVSHEYTLEIKDLSYEDVFEMYKYLMHGVDLSSSTRNDVLHIEKLPKYKSGVSHHGEAFRVEVKNYKGSHYIAGVEKEWLHSITPYLLEVPEGELPIIWDEQSQAVHIFLDEKHHFMVFKLSYFSHWNTSATYRETLFLLPPKNMSRAEHEAVLDGIESFLSVEEDSKV